MTTTKGHTTPVTSKSFTVRHGRIADIPRLVELFAEMGFSRLHGFGVGFARLMHRHIVRSPHATCIVAEVDGRILGYITGAFDGSRFAKTFILKYGVLAGLMILPRLLRPTHVKTLYNCLTYFGRNPFGDQKESGLTFGVSKESRRMGVGRAVFMRLMDEFRERGAESFSFMTDGAENAPANKFYRSLGCEYLGQYQFYESSAASMYRMDLS